MIRITDELFVDEESNELVINNATRIKVENQVIRLLVTLSSGDVITHDEFIRKVWEGNEAVGEKALSKNIYKLRELLRSLPTSVPIGIETISKKGYRLIAGPGSQPSPSRHILWVILGILAITILVILDVSKSPESSTPVMVIPDNSDTIIFLGDEPLHVIDPDSGSNLDTLRLN